MPLMTRRLYHFWLSPASRKVRLILREKTLDFELTLERPWERRHEFLALNPAGEVPVLVEPDGTTIVGGSVIPEYLEEVYPERTLLGTTVRDRAETRRLVAWFDEKFQREVTANLVEEKMVKRYLGQGEPNSLSIRAGYQNIKTHLDYIGYLLERRNYLAGESFSLADLAAAAHLSCLDYLGDVPWERYPPAKDWYARIKSRPSFRSLLQDHVPGATPPKHYGDLDF